MGYVHGRGYNFGVNGGRQPVWEEPQQLPPPAAGDAGAPGGIGGGACALLSTQQLASFAERRFIVLDNVFPPALLAAHTAIHSKHFPDPGPDLREAPTASVQFPFAEDDMAANLITLHPRVLSVVSQLLGTDDIRLTRSNLSQKYGIGVHQPDAEVSKGDQSMHKASSQCAGTFCAHVF